MLEFKIYTRKIGYFGDLNYKHRHENEMFRSKHAG